MAKIMLVEDDNNLREIYEARLAAEGYEIVSAADGEAALALAIKERPDLIISDIMMPKVSGFDMLDILRSTTETKDCKIIMMTALNQAEDKARAEKLGADMYLVKSQVTLEDVVRAAKSVLGDQTPLSVGGIPVEHPAPASPANATSLTGGTPAPAVTPPAPQPVAATPTPAPVQPVTPAPSPTPQPTAPTSQATTTEQEEAALQAQIEQFISTDKPADTPAPAVTPPAPQPVAATPTPAPVQPVTPAPSPTPQPTAPPTVQLSTAPLTVAPEPAPDSTAATTSLDEDKPAGEQIIVKSAPASSGEPGIDASVSGRKKVIQPITDVMAGGPDLNALAAKEAGGSASPVINSVVTPEGVTMQSAQPTTAPTMSDVIAPSPTPPVQSSTSLPPPVA